MSSVIDGSNPSSSAGESSLSQVDIEARRLNLEQRRVELEAKKIEAEIAGSKRNTGIRVTAMIGLATVFVSLAQLALAKAQYGNNVKQFQRDEDQRWRFQLAAFISQNSDDVFSPDTLRRNRVEQTIRGIFPDSVITPFFKQIKQAARDSAVKAAYEKGLNEIKLNERPALIAAMFTPGDEQKPTRMAALDKMIENWGGDSVAVSQLIRYAAARPTNEHGVMNTLMFLENASPEVVRAQRAALEPLLDQVKKNGPKTADHVDRVRRVLGPAPGRVP
jgi:hypothetical protein